MEIALNLLTRIIMDGAIAYFSCYYYAKIQQPSIGDLPTLKNKNFRRCAVGFTIILVISRLLADNVPEMMQFWAQILRLVADYVIFCFIAFAWYNDSNVNGYSDKNKLSYFRHNVIMSLICFGFVSVVWAVLSPIVGAIVSSIIQITLSIELPNSILPLTRLISVAAIVPIHLGIGYLVEQKGRVYFLNSIEAQSVLSGVAIITMIIYLLARNKAVLDINMPMPAKYIMFFLGLFLCVFCALHFVVQNWDKCKVCSEDANDLKVYYEENKEEICYGNGIPSYDKQWNIFAQEYTRLPLLDVS